MEEIKMKMQEYVGTRDHDKMYNRDLAKQHPIKAIDGLEEKIAELEEYHVYLYNRIGELKQLIETEKLSLQNIADAEQAARQNILTATNLAGETIGVKRDEAVNQVRAEGSATIARINTAERQIQEYTTLVASKTEEAQGYAEQAEEYLHQIEELLGVEEEPDNETI